jgi:DNA-directed RNA polymerase specialized sigma24 family protein
MIDDQVLIQRCLAGDSKAWDSLVARFSPTVYETVLELLEELPEDLASGLDPEEITLQVFASLLEDGRRRLAQVGESADVGPWLILIARRLLLKECKNLKPYRKFAEGLEANFAQGASLRKTLRAEFAELPPRDRLALALFLFESPKTRYRVKPTGNRTLTGPGRISRKDAKPQSRNLPHLPGHAAALATLQK